MNGFRGLRSMLAADALTGSGGGHRGEPLSQQHVRAPRNGRVDFAAGISIGGGFVLGFVSCFAVEIAGYSRNCSWWFPQDSTSELCKLLNLLMPK